MASTTTSDIGLEAHFWARTDRREPDECWPWTGSILPRGYGQLTLRSDAPSGVSTRRAHRIAFELLVGPIPEGMEIDHTCHTNDLACRAGDECPHRRCVNPAHLEVVTHAENIRRAHAAVGVENSNGRKTHCANGHPFSEENTYRRFGRRYCRICNAEYVRQWRERERSNRGPSRHNGVKTHCPQGHEYTPENTRTHDSRRFCRTCGIERARAWREVRKVAA